MIRSDVQQTTENDLEYLAERKVEYFVHFASLENVESILHHGLLPRASLEANEMRYDANDHLRLDGLSHINLSITHPNISLFFRMRKKYPERCYVVLRLNPGVLRWLAQNYGENSYCFKSTNAASRRAESCNVERLFAGSRDPGLMESWPTDSQAEILVNHPIPREFVDGIVLPSRFGEDPAQVVRLNSIEKCIVDLGLSCKVLKNDLYFDDVRSKLKNAGNREKYTYYFSSWDVPLNNFSYVESWVESMPSLATFDSTAFPLRMLDAALKQKKEKDIRPRWSLKFRKNSAPIKLTDAETGMLAALEKIINRSRIGVLSEALEAGLDRLIARETEAGSRSAYAQWCFRTAHQIQASIVELVKQQCIGMSARLCFTMNGVGQRELDVIAERALKDLADLAAHLSDLYDCSNLVGGISVCAQKDEADLVLNWTSADDVGDDEVDLRTAHIYGFTLSGQDAAYHLVQTQVAVKMKPTVNGLTFLLNYIFRFENFREGQIPALLRALSAKDTIVLLPTGSGKSIIFQLLALITPGTAFVVSPITSLIDDQVMNLQQKGIDRVVGLTGQTDDKRTVERLLATGSYLMCYVAPERFQIRSFANAVKNYAKTNLVSVIAIDEAHCVSEWGHDFRPSYLGLARTCREVCRTGSRVPPLLALTGTASLSVLIDMKHDLEISDPSSIIRPKSFDRPEIHYRVMSIKSEQKLEALGDILRNQIPRDLGLPPEEIYQATGNDDTRAGIIFCQNVNGRYGLVNERRSVENGHPGVWDYMEQQFPGANTFYCGSKPKHVNTRNWATTKQAQALSFKKNEKSVMVATKAFGMGIDKPNVRWVVHFGMPASLESYYQEVGRAARDRNDAYAYLILSDDYPQINNAALDPARASLAKVGELEKSKGAYRGDDVSRCLFFHAGTFEGVDAEMKVAEDTLEQCTRENYRFKRWVIPFAGGKGDGKNATERAIYRLTLLGVFKSYSVDYHGGGEGEFIVEPAQVRGRELREAIYANYRAYIESYQSDRAFLNQSMAALNSVVSGIEGDRAFIFAVLRHLLETFTYRVIEEGRRRAIMTMLEVARRTAAIGDVKAAEESLRSEIIDYLSTGDDEEQGLGSILYDATNIVKLLAVIEASADNPRGIAQQALRLLEDYPQHYGLYFIAAALQAIAGEAGEATRSLNGMFLFGVNSYGLNQAECANNFLMFLDSETGNRIHIEIMDEALCLIAKEGGVCRSSLSSGRSSRKMRRIEAIRRLSRLCEVVRKEL